MATTHTSVADPENTTPHKVHIRGVDDLTTNNIKAFSTENFPSASPTRIEWIDDTSANIVYNTPSTGLTALEQLSLASSSNLQLTDLRQAKPFTMHPGAALQVRIALASDQKRPRAHEASRFYMMHPEYDPREQRRRDRSHGNTGDYRLRRYGDAEDRKRRRKDREEGFDASMYDDDNASSSRRASLSSSQEGRARRTVDSYRPRSETAGGARARSASPDRHNGDGNRGRNRTPPPLYQRRDPYPFPTENTGKELFPTISKAGSDKASKDLFSDKMLAASSRKELLPHKANAVSHRRSDAFDAADETADLFASGMCVPFTDVPRRGANKGLPSGIAAPSEPTYGRLQLSDLEPSMDVEKDDGITIRGASRQDQGFTIRGGASGLITELFPDKAAVNAGKELFAEKIKGRGMRRTRAEDMFY